MTAPSLAGDASAGRRADGGEPIAGRQEAIPRHVAIIMDGNRRWARERGLPEAQGHAAGVEAVRPIVEHAVRRGVEVLTIYAFSRENWARASNEVETLIGLLEATIRDQTPRLVEEGVRVRMLGRTDELPPLTRASIEEALAATEGGERMILNVAFNYSSRAEIVDAVRALHRGPAAPRTTSTRRTSPRISTRPASRSRTSSSAPAATSGSATSCSGRPPMRSSTSATCYWPDFGPDQLDAAFAEFARRSRRFGR